MVQLSSPERHGLFRSWQLSSALLGREIVFNLDHLENRDLVRVKLEFFKPFAATNTAAFNFKSEGNQTAVTWSMFGQNNSLPRRFLFS
jgi:hypothetical protein